MRTFLTFILTCVGVLAANPPIVLNPWTTNRAPPVVGTNLGISNNASGFMWKFYGYPGSNTVARLMDLDPYALTNEAVVWHDTIYGNVWTNNLTFGVLFLSDAGNSAGSIVFSGDGNDVFKFVDLNLYTNLWCDSDFNTWQFDHTPTVGPYGTIGIPLLTNCNATVGVALSNTVSQVAFAMTNVLPLLTNHWYYFTNVAWTNHTLKFTNVTAGTETRIYVKGGDTNYTLNFLWPAGVVATWLSTTNDSMRSNRVTHINVSCWDATNIVLVGKEAP